MSDAGGADGTAGESTHVHEHGHPHDHDHPHPPAGETLPEPSGPGSVVATIGGDRGVAVVNTPASLDGEEIEIRPEPGEWIGEHVAVRPRPMPAGTIYAAFFDGLPAGSYRLRVRFGPDGGVEVPLEVVGGQVAVVNWPGTPPPP